MIRAVHHVGISTPNLARLRSFYCDLLGFTELSHITWQPGEAQIDKVMALSGTAASVAMLKMGPTCVELFQFEAPPQPPRDAGDRPVQRHGMSHLCFDVADVEADYQRLLAAGVRFHAPPQDFGSVKATYGRDPDGNVFELQQIVDG
ncbi:MULTISPECIES: VOC family protein [Zoogloea]|jgi:catechol 2,3-dioxygenase-like lactoylglutathione lyase family enzyme|uniref:VOC family protein n=1 Tax=Zoogloea oleivorans TaxID=1552750 RepID=A0A6C2CLK5_9RHOO|nr:MULTISPECIES: VOC family protein [Zoogloea]MBT9498210.1 VOC family protein [Zoogloea sp.]MDD2669180.1 VOC family protein [Zoogloea sp.]TYC55250.1 VOC family protein [Zoogloea oleivorans]